MSTTASTDQTSPLAALFPIDRFDGEDLWLIDMDGRLRRAHVSARFSIGDIKAFVARKAQALVIGLEPVGGDAPEVLGVVIDFVAALGRRRGGAILCADEIRLGDGAARIYWDADALHIAAENIDSQAKYLHRITGGSIKIG